VPKRQLHHTLNDFRRTLQDCSNLAEDAHQWSLPGSHPHIPRKRSESMIELAFLRAYLAWEVFLEESFVLYLLGMKAPRRAAPKRFTFPPSRRLAKEWIVPEGRPFAKWDANSVRVRAGRFFHGGKPFTAALQSNQYALDQAKTIRNAIAHESDEAREKFKTLARDKLNGTLPPTLTAGGFLNAPVPGLAPTQSFLEFYLERIEFVARQIVPT